MENETTIRRYIIDNILYTIKYNEISKDFAMFKDIELLFTSMSLNKVDEYWDSFMYQSSKC